MTDETGTNAGAIGAPPPVPRRSRNKGTRFAQVVGVVILLIIVWSVLRGLSLLFITPAQLEVVAQIVPHETDDPSEGDEGATSNSPQIRAEPGSVGDTPGGSITGRVLRRGEPMGDVRVWAVVVDTSGNHVATSINESHADGRFAVDFSLQETETIRRATIFAREVEKDQAASRLFVVAKRVFHWVVGGGRILEGKETLIVKNGQVRRELHPRVPRAAVSVPVAIFLLSIINAIVFAYDRMRVGSYIVALVLSVALTITMIGVIGLGLFYVNNLPEGSEDTVSLGFASIFKGTYVEGMPKQSLFSITNPVVAEERMGIEKGFGAPLWVMLVSVVGAALLTVTLVVREVGKFGSAVKAKITSDLEITLLLEHQFYMMFAPLGAVFVYQLMVIGDAASNSATVAIAALGSGATLNGLLQFAVKKAKEAIN